MPNTNFNRLFKSLAMNAQSRQTETNITNDNYYVTGASLNESDDVLTLAVKGANNVTVDLSHLAGGGTGTKYPTAMAYAPSTQKYTLTLADSSTVVSTPSLRVFGDSIALSGTNEGQLDLYEKSSNGNAYVSIRAAQDWGTDSAYILELPTTDGDNGQYLVSNGSGVLSWATPSDANYYVTGGTYSAGSIAFSGTTGFSGFSVTGIGDVTGGGADNRLAHWTSASNVTGTTGLTYDTSTDILKLTSSQAYVSTPFPKLIVENTNADAYPPTIELYKNSASADNTDLNGVLYFYGNNNNATPEKIDYSRIESVIGSMADGSERSILKFYNKQSGINNNVLTLSGNSTAGFLGTIVASGGLTLPSTSDDFTMGGNAVNDIKIHSDSVSTSNSDLVTAKYIGTHYAPVSITGTIGGSIADNQVAFGATTANSIEGSANFTYDGTDLSLTSATSNKPVFTLENTNSDDAPAFLDFKKNVADGQQAASDTLGQIRFYGKDSANNLDSFVDMYAKSPTITSTSEDGALFMRTRAAGTMTQTLALNAGNVGINTTSPNYALDVNGDIRIEDAHYLRFGGNGASDSEWIIQQASNNLNFGEVGVADNVLYLKAGGNVGIGTAAPSTKLEVVSSDGFAGYFQGTSSATIASDTTNNHYLRIKNASTTDATTALLGFQLGSGYQGGFVGTEQYDADDANNSYANLVFGTKVAGTSAPLRRMTIEHTGDVGIGTSGPDRKLHVHNASTSVGLKLSNDSTGQGSADGFYIDMGATDAEINNKETGKIAFATANSTRMTIDSAGDVGIGTTSPSAKLDVVGNQSISGYIGRDTHNYIDFGTDNVIRFRINDSMSHQITTSSSNVVFQPLIDGKDIIFKQYDGDEVIRLTDAKNLDLPSNNAILFDNTNDNNQSFIRNGGTNAVNMQFGLGTPDNANVKMILDGDGDVGIGTTSPGQKLHVEGSIAVSGAESAGDSGYGNSFYQYNQSGAQTLRMYSDSNNSAGSKRQHINASARLSISSTEHIAIGPSTSAEYLHLYSAATAHMYLDAGGDFQFRDKDDSSAVRMRLASADGALGVAGLITASGGATIASSQNFTMGGQATNDILISSDSSSTSDTVLVTAGYVDAHAGGGGGTFGGSLSSGKLAIGTGTDTIGNFVDALTEDNSIYIGVNPTSTTSTAEFNVGLGINALNAITTGDKNVAIGYGAGKVIDAESENTLVGAGAGENLTASYNVFVGSSAGANATSVQKSVFIGRQAAGAAAATGDDNTIVGYKAGYDLTTGYSNVVMGYATAENITEGHKNVILGHRAGDSITTAHSNIAIGYETLNSTTLGSENVAIGAYAGTDYVGGNSTTGAFGVFVGHTAGFKVTGNTSYKGITLVGHAAGYDATGAQQSTGIGQSALYYANGALNTTAVGRKAGYKDTGTGSVWVGDSAGHEINGDYNTVMGFGALSGASSGTGFGTATLNVAIGRDAMTNVTSGKKNVAIGNDALKSVTTGENLVAIGYLAGDAQTTDDEGSIYIGSSAGSSDDGTNRNIFIGFDAGNKNTTGANNLAIGHKALEDMVSGIHNVAIGREAGKELTGNQNVAVGTYALQDRVAGYYNTVVGDQAMRDSTAGDKNVILGTSAMGNDTVGTGGGENVVAGFAALRKNTGQYNVVVGSEAATAATALGNSVVIGRQAMGGAAATGTENVAIGFVSMLDNTSGPYNVAVGAYAATGNTTGQENTAVGHSALQENQEGDHIVAIGRYAAYNTNPTAGTGDSVVVGTEAGWTNTTGVKNVLMGYKAGYNSTTTSNHVMIGYEAGFYNTIGGSNTFIGQRGGYSNTEGENNTAVGFQAGYYNTTGDGNVFIGKSAGPSSTNTDSNKLYIHNAAGTPLIAGDFSAGSVTINGSITGTTNAAITNNMTIGTNVDLQGAGNSTFAGGNTIFGASNVSQNTYLKVLGSGAGYTAAGIKLLTYNGNDRPGGVYSYAHAGTQAWYSGPVYGASYKWGVNYKSSIANTGSGLELVADDAYNLFMIDKTGQVGIGTTSPASKLHVPTSGTIANGISVGAAGNSGMYAFNANQMRFAVAGVDKLRVTESKAQFGSDGSWSPAVFVGTGSANPPNATNIAFKPLSDDTDTGYSRSADNTLALVAGGTQIMTATDSAVSITGNLMFPDSNNTISAFGSDNLYLRAHNDMYFNIDTPNDSTSRHFIFRANTSSEIMRLGEDLIAEFKGNVGIGTAAPNQALEVVGNITTSALDTEYRFGNRSDLLIRGHSDFDMELISPQDMAFSIDSDNNETAHKFLFKTNTTTPRSAGTTLMEISEAGDVTIAGGLGVTGSTLAVQKTIKNDIAGNHTISDSYSHYMATADNQGTATCTITCPASPSVGDEYFIVAQCIYASAMPSNALVQITPNTGQTINQAVNAGSNIALHQVSSGTGAGGQPLISYKTAHLICVDVSQWVLTVSDVGPTS